MKSSFLPLFLAFAFTTLNANADLVTLTAANNSFDTNNIAELTIGPFEIAELVSFSPTIDGDSYIEILKDRRSFTHYVRRNSGYPFDPFEPLLVKGPATFRLKAPNLNSQALCTFRISPESFPPDRTIIVPPGTNQVAVALECSTNLVQWFSATNGTYGNLNEAKFFRIKAQRLP